MPSSSVPPSLDVAARPGLSVLVVDDESQVGVGEAELGAADDPACPPVAALIIDDGVAQRGDSPRAPALALATTATRYLHARRR